jgi:hypothetical protein
MFSFETLSGTKLISFELPSLFIRRPVQFKSGNGKIFNELNLLVASSKICFPSISAAAITALKLSYWDKLEPHFLYLLKLDLP